MSRKVLIALALTAALGASAAMASDGPPQGNFFNFNDNFQDWNKHHHHLSGGPAAAPEIDPASAIGALTLLAGGLAVVRGRRSKR